MKHFKLTRAQEAQRIIIAQKQAVRGQLIEHLKCSSIQRVDIDSYVDIAISLFELSNTPIGDICALPDSLHTLVQEQPYVLQEHKQKNLYIAKMLNNIKEGKLSDRCESVPVMCPDCGQYTKLTASHHPSRKTKYVYFCDSCENSVSAFEGDKWPTGIPASLSIRKMRSDITMAIRKVATRLGVTERKIRLKLGSEMSCVDSDIININAIQTLDGGCACLEALKIVESRITQ